MIIGGISFSHSQTLQPQHPPLNILLFPLGSAGDVYPFVGLGLRLGQRGHDVTVATAAPFRKLIEQAGLNYVELGSQQEYDNMLNNPDVWHPFKGFEVLVRQGILPSMRRQYAEIADRYQPGRTLVIGSTLSLGARMAHDKLGVPLIGVHLQPAVIWSEHVSPRMGPMWAGRWVPRWMKRFQFYLAKMWMLDRVMLREINAFREDLGMAPLRSVHPLFHSPQRVIGMFPDWYAPPQPDWPGQVVLTGFPLWDCRDITEAPAEAEQFLAAGEPPVIFTAGTAMVHGQAFFSTAVETCRLLGRRGILLARHAGQIPQRLPDSIRHFSYLPFSRVFGRAATVVHHGGIGTLSQALAAGVPQLVMPMSHDQPDNAARLARLGVAESIKPAAFRAPAVARSLQRLLDSPQVRSRCQQIAARLEGVDALSQTCDVVEQMIQEGKK